MTGSSWNDFVNEPGFSGGGKRLKDWKSKGQVIVWIHTDTRIHKRLFHMLPYVGTKVDDAGKERSTILYLPFVCHEEPSRYQNKETPLHCPICRFMDYLGSTSSVEDGDIVWDASVRDRKRDRVVTKADFIGDIAAGGDWKLSFKPALQYIIGVIKHPEGEETPELVIATEKYSLGEAIKRAVRQEIDSKGPELGDPGVTPYAFKWVFDVNARVPSQYYSAYRYDIAQLTPAISELLASPAPDLTPYLSPGDTKKLREIMTNTVPSDVLSPDVLEELFSNVKPNQGTESEPWDEDDDEEEPKAEKKPSVPETPTFKPQKRRGRPPSVKKAEPKPEPKREPPPAKEPEPPQTSQDEVPLGEPCVLCKGTGEWRGRTCIDCGGSGEKKDRTPEKRVRTARKPKIEAPPPPSDDDVVCGKCGEVVHEDDTSCPNCGSEFE